MAKRQKQDSVQERAVEGSLAEQELRAARMRSRLIVMQIHVRDLHPGLFLVHSRKRGQEHLAARVEKCMTIVPSRRGTHLKVNNSYIYTVGGYADVLATPEHLHLSIDNTKLEYSNEAS
jgi:hypothetical protein